MAEPKLILEPSASRNAKLLLIFGFACLGVNVAVQFLLPNRFLPVNIPIINLNLIFAGFGVISGAFGLASMIQITAYQRIDRKYSTPDQLEESIKEIPKEAWFKPAQTSPVVPPQVATSAPVAQDDFTIWKKQFVKRNAQGNLECQLCKEKNLPEAAFTEATTVAHYRIKHDIDFQS